jgi:hypothetical protein
MPAPLWRDKSLTTLSTPKSLFTKLNRQLSVSFKEFARKLACECPFTTKRRSCGVEVPSATHFRDLTFPLSSMANIIWRFIWLHPGLGFLSPLVPPTKRSLCSTGASAPANLRDAQTGVPDFFPTSKVFRCVWHKEGASKELQIFCLQFMRSRQAAPQFFVSCRNIPCYCGVGCLSTKANKDMTFF